MKINSNILAKVISGNASPEEVKQVGDQLSADHALREEHDAYSRVWELSSVFQHESSAQDWDAFKAIVKAPKKELGFDWLKVAASITLLAAFSVIIYLMSGPQQAIHASHTQVELADKTVVVLDGNTQVIPTLGYGKSARNVEMSGHAYFDVARYSLPFTLELNAGLLEVTGTQFSILDPLDSDYSVITLHEGSVRFTDLQGLDHTLKPGQRLIAGKDGVSLEALSSADVEWIYSNEIICRDMSLEQMMHELEHHYLIDFDLPKRALKEHYTLHLPKGDLSACIELISAVSGLDLQLQDGVLSVKALP